MQERYYLAPDALHVHEHNYIFLLKSTLSYKRQRKVLRRFYLSMLSIHLKKRLMAECAKRLEKSIHAHTPDTIPKRRPDDRQDSPPAFLHKRNARIPVTQELKRLASSRQIGAPKELAVQLQTYHYSGTICSH